MLSNNEKREFILGYFLEQRLLLVVYLEKGKCDRIIILISDPSQGIGKPEKLKHDLSGC